MKVSKMFYYLGTFAIVSLVGHTVNAATVVPSLTTTVFNITANGGHPAVTANVTINIIQHNQTVLVYTGIIGYGGSLQYHNSLVDGSPITVASTYTAAVGGALLATCSETLAVFGKTPQIFAGIRSEPVGYLCKAVHAY